MSFQFFSKLDNKFTDGPVSQLDPYRAVKSLIGGTGEMSRAISKTIQDDKRQSRMARRAYRSAMRSNDPNQIMAVSRFLTEQAEFGRPGVTGRPNNAVLIAGNEFQSRGGDLSRVQQGNQEFGSTLENRSSGFGDVTDTQPGFAGSQSQGRLSAAEESKLKTRELTLAGNFGPRAQRELEARMAREEGGSLFQKSSKEDGRRFGIAYEKQQLAEESAKAAQAEKDTAAFVAEGDEIDRVAERNRSMDGTRESRTEPNPALDAAMSRLEEISNRTKEVGDAREKAALERRAAFDARGKEIEAEKATAVAAAEGRYSSALVGLENRAKVREEQTKVTDDYFSAAELQSATLNDSEANALARGLPFKEEFNKTYDYPFKPHGIDSGSLRAEASNAEQYKKAIERGSDFNAALGGKQVTVRYNESSGNYRGGSKKTGKFKSVFGDKSVSFQNDAFRPLKEIAISSPLNHKGGEKPALDAMDKIIKAAVDNKYPIELDGDLMAVPRFRQKLADARVKSGMKTDKITGYTSFSFD